MKRTSPEKYKELSDRDRSIAVEYYRLRKLKGLRSIDAYKALEELGTYLSESGTPLTAKTMRSIVKNKRYLKKDRQ